MGKDTSPYPGYSSKQKMWGFSNLFYDGVSPNKKSFLLNLWVGFGVINIGP